MIASTQRWTTSPRGPPAWSARSAEPWCPHPQTRMKSDLQWPLSSSTQRRSVQRDACSTTAGPLVVHSPVSFSFFATTAGPLLFTHQFLFHSLPQLRAPLLFTHQFLFHSLLQCRKKAHGRHLKGTSRPCPRQALGCGRPFLILTPFNFLTPVTPPNGGHTPTPTPPPFPSHPFLDTTLSHIVSTQRRYRLSEV